VGVGVGTGTGAGATGAGGELIGETKGLGVFAKGFGVSMFITIFKTIIFQTTKARI
jgi:hypothetical protein